MPKPIDLAKFMERKEVHYDITRQKNDYGFAARVRSYASNNPAYAQNKLGNNYI